mmetsp:Transcript_34075/g.63080  ORF Transcript_34075/g.63080 Transcript_34075/m.63080 type:complete len:82 (+) Transcript_34075:35-280(+)
MTMFTNWFVGIFCQLKISLTKLPSQRQLISSGMQMQFTTTSLTTLLKLGGSKWQKIFAADFDVVFFVDMNCRVDQEIKELV